MHRGVGELGGAAEDRCRGYPLCCCGPGPDRGTHPSAEASGSRPPLGSLVCCVGLGPGSTETWGTGLLPAAALRGRASMGGQGVLSALFSFPPKSSACRAGHGRLAPAGGLMASGAPPFSGHLPARFLPFGLCILKSWVSSPSRNKLKAQSPTPPGAPHQAGQMGGSLRPTAPWGLGPAVSTFPS